MYCKKCGKLLNQGEVICTNCGTSNDTNNVGNNNNFNIPNQFNMNTNNQNNISNGVNVNSNQTLNNGVDAFAAFNQNFDSTTTNNTNNVNNSDNYNNQNVNQTNMSNGFENLNLNNPATQQNVDNSMGNNNFTNSNNNIMGNVGSSNNQNINTPNNTSNFNSQNFETFNNDNFNNQNFSSSNNNSSFGNSKNKVIFLILGVIIVIIVIFVSIFLYTSLTSKKMVCKSSYGDFTLKYKGSKITGYTASGTFGEQIDFDIDEQNKNAKELGMDEYLRTFSTVFISATDGTCTIDGKDVNADTEDDSNVLDGDVWDKENDSKVIGNSKYGYVKVPKDWVEFKDVNGNNMVQYSYAGKYIVSLYAYDGSQYSAKDYATAYETEMKKSADVVSASLVGYTENLNGSYDANRVNVDYSDGTKMYTYWFEAEDGNVHYIAIKGPEELDGKSFYDFIRIADTFTLTN